MCERARSSKAIQYFFRWLTIKEVPFDSKYLRVRQAQFPPSRKQILPVTDKLNGKGNSTYSRANDYYLMMRLILYNQLGARGLKSRKNRRIMQKITNISICHFYVLLFLFKLFLNNLFNTGKINSNTQSLTLVERKHTHPYTHTHDYMKNTHQHD